MGTTKKSKNTKKKPRSRTTTNNNKKAQSSVMGTIEDITIDATSAGPTKKSAAVPPSQKPKDLNQNNEMMLPPSTPVTPPPGSLTPVTPNNQWPAAIIPTLEPQSAGVPNPFSQPMVPNTPMPRKALRDYGTVDDAEESERKRIRDVMTAWTGVLLTKGVKSLVDEYREIPNAAPEDKAKTFKENPKKNRYHNIVCCEASRVRLQFDPSFYIHANVVSSAGRNQRFICAQAPLPGTIDDFWTMIVTTQIELIVMLCDLVENGKPKSAEYFPTKMGDTKDIEKVCHVTLVEQKEVGSPNLVLSTFRVANWTKTGSEIVKHLHWHNWPDHGVPDNYTGLHLVLTQMRTLKSSKPVVIHCSAGVGRTGTLALYVILIESITRPNFGGVPRLLARLREERYKSVQTEMQYLYVHRCMLEYLTKSKNVPFERDLYEKFIREYDQQALVPVTPQ